MGHVWIYMVDYVLITGLLYGSYNNPNTNLKNNTKMGHWAQNQASAGQSSLTWTL